MMWHTRFRPMFRFSRFALLLLMPICAFAQVTPVIFERASIRIDSPAPRAADAEPVPTHPSYLYQVEVRPEDAMRLEYIHTLNTLSEGNGVMIAFTAPSMVALPVMNVYTPVDALFVADNGVVEQILPNVVLGELTQAVMAHGPVKAFLFLDRKSVV